MPDHLKDLGRDIAETLPRCFWPSTQTIDDLLQQTHVIAEVRGIRMLQSENKDTDKASIPGEYQDNDY